MSNPVIDLEGNKRWRDSKGQFHRLDGPAIEYISGSKAWYVEGKPHRLDGPAIEWVDGHKAWFKNGKRHRLDGPAVEFAAGDKEWWVDGVEVTEEDYLEAVLLYRCKVVLDS
jgi:hypothetical protein